MMKLVTAESVSDAWCEAIRATRQEKDNKIFHLAVSIGSPLLENQDVRDRVEKILADQHLQPVDTVANTIMPTRWAQICKDHDDFVARYTANYDRITRFSPSNWGTYFGRLVAYPVGSGKRPAPVDQLGPIIRTLKRTEIMRAEYETAIVVAGEADDTEDRAAAATIHHPTRGARGRGGPCLSHVAFQRDGDSVHAVAHYRSQYLVERAYGNYLGLGRLLQYVSEQADLKPGQLTIVAGYAQIERAIDAVDDMVRAFPRGGGQAG